jgi:hypothetical protein
MLALTDSQLARLCMAATALAPKDRWLHDIAERLDPPPRRVLRDLPKAKGAREPGGQPPVENRQILDRPFSESGHCQGRPNQSR